MRLKLDTEEALWILCGNSFQIIEPEYTKDLRKDSELGFGGYTFKVEDERSDLQWMSEVKVKEFRRYMGAVL